MTEFDPDTPRSEQSRLEPLALNYALSRSPAVFYLESSEDSRLDYLSENAEQHLGYPRERLQPAGLRLLLHPDDESVLVTQRRNARHDAPGRTQTCDYRLRTPHGYRWFRDSTEYAQGQFTGCLIDITAEKMAGVSATADLALQRSSESALRASEALIRSVVEACPVPIVVSRLDGTIVYQSPSSLALFGHAETQFRDLLGAQTGNLFLEELSARGAIDNLAQQYEAGDGRRFWGAISARVIDCDGEPVIVSTIADITACKQAEEKLRANSDMVRRVLEAAPLPIRMVRLNDGLVLYASPADQALFGDERYAAESFAAPQDRESLVAELQRTGFVEDAAYRFKRADGSLFPGSISARVIDYEGAAVTVSTTADLTERQAIEAELRASEQMVRHVLESCPTSIQMNRLNGEILYQSPATLELFGESREDGPRDVIHRYKNKADREAYLRALHERGRVDDYHVDYRRHDGTVFRGSVSSRLVDFKGERVIVSAYYDLTNDLAREQEMIRQREALHQSEKLSALGELLAGVAHELNNPLSIVVGQTRLLHETTSDPQAAQRADKIGAAANRCARIVKTFLAMARQQPQQRAAVDVNRIIADALEVITYTMTSTDIHLTQQLADNLPPVWGDGDQLAQVLVNLLINAQHALQEVDGERAIRVSTAHHDEQREVVVTVSDNGPGVPEALRGRIFEPFFTTKDVGVGTGVGLAFCHRVLAAHGASIKLDPDNEQGAAFVLRLPALTARAAAQIDSAAPELPPARPRSVLILDDEQEVAEMIAEIARGDGHRVTLAHSGRAGLSLIEQQSFDVILSDLRMPDLDGPGLYRILRSRCPAAISALAFITGDTLSPGVKRFLDQAERPYLEKPLLPQDVRRLISGIDQPVTNA